MFKEIKSQNPSPNQQSQFLIERSQIQHQLLFLSSKKEFKKNLKDALSKVSNDDNESDETSSSVKSWLHNWRK